MATVPAQSDLEGRPSPEARSQAGVPALDLSPPAQAQADLRDCCAATRWAQALVERRPFGTLDTLLSAADEVWWSLEPSDWLEAFRAHPRIGGRKASKPQSSRGHAWSAGEQSGMASAAATTQARLAELNDVYYERFGFIFIVCASGKQAAEMLALLEARLPNDRDTEIRIAAEEQRKITRIRLKKLVRS